MNPKILMSAINDMENLLAQTQKQLDNHFRDRQAHQFLSEEYGQRATHDIGIRKEEATEDLERLLELHSESKQAIQTAENLKCSALHRLNLSYQQKDEADKNLIFWQYQLKLAIAWVRRAKERVKQAEKWVIKAKAEVQYCQDDVQSCKEALYRAEQATTTVYDHKGYATEVKGRDTAPYRRALERAQSNLKFAKQDLQEAQKELRKAVDELFCAEKQEYGSRCAVNDSESAIQATIKGISRAKSACIFASKALDEAMRAEKSASIAVENIQLALDQITSAEQVMNRVQTELDQGRLSLQRVQEETDSVNLNTYRAKTSLSEKYHWLNLFNQSSSHFSQKI